MHRKNGKPIIICSSKVLEYLYTKSILMHVYICRLLQSLLSVCTYCVYVCVHTYIKVTQFSCCLFVRASQSLKLVSFFTPDPFRSSAALWYFKIILKDCLILLNTTWASCHLCVTLLHTSCDWVNWSHVEQTSNWILILALFTISHSVWIKVNHSNHFFIGD